MDAVDGHRKKIAKAGVASYWSPDGTKIVYTVQPNLLNLPFWI